MERQELTSIHLVSTDAARYRQDHLLNARRSLVPGLAENSTNPTHCPQPCTLQTRQCTGVRRELPLHGRRTSAALRSSPTREQSIPNTRNARIQASEARNQTPDLSPSAPASIGA